MDWRFIAALFFLQSVVKSCQGVNPSAEFNMNGVTGTASCSISGNVLTVNLLMDTTLSTTIVSLRPLWTNYDVEDKCSDSQLGQAETGRSAKVFGGSVQVNIQRNQRATVTFQNVESLNSIEGYSILLVPTNQNIRICATLWKEGQNHMAVARFRGSVLGSVYFRQHNSAGSITRIVTDLFTATDSRSGTWRISDSHSDCASYTADRNSEIYDPENSAGQGCATDAQFSCAQGDLSGKLGNVNFGQNSGGVKNGYTDQNLFLSGDSSIEGKLLIIYPTGHSGFSSLCAEISMIRPRQARVDFGHSGISGFIEFSQNTPLDSTSVDVNLENLRRGAGGYHVHKWPTPSRTTSSQALCDNVAVSGHWNPYNSNYPQAQGGTDDMYEVGDLSGKYGLLTSLENHQGTYTDWNLPLFGTNSIVGRSVVIHRSDNTASRWVCSNIEPVHPVTVVVAKFKYPVIGQVTFMQDREDPYADTTIFAELDNSDGLVGTQDHQWGIHANPPSSDMLNENVVSRCQSAGVVYNPERLWSTWSNSQYVSYCDANKMSACKLGDLGRRLATLSIRNSNSASSDKTAKAFFTATNAPLSGPHSILNRSLVIMNEAGDARMACAKIQRQHSPHLVARLLGGGVNGVVHLTQNPGLGAKWTTVSSELNGFTNNLRFRIYELPPMPNDDSCSNLGDMYNPYGLGNPTIPITDDEYMVGDLHHHGASSEFNSSNLPLSGVVSVQGRALVVEDVNAQNAIRACGQLEVALPQDQTSLLMTAAATFTGDVMGTIHLMQAVFSDGTMSDTSIIFNASNSDDSLSPAHNWHTHARPVEGDAHATSGRCSSTGPHFDPYFAMKSNKDVYPQECSPSNPLRCELGDQAKKVGTFDIGGGRNAFNDVDLPLGGIQSVLGKSFVIHAENRGAPRIACADIIPETSENIRVEFTTPSNMDKRQAATIYATAVQAIPYNVVVEVTAQESGRTFTIVHFVGPQAKEMRDRFKDFIKDESRRSTLGDYEPIVDAAGLPVISGVLLVAVALLHTWRLL